jgi:hypothetical protein
MFKSLNFSQFMPDCSAVTGYHRIGNTLIHVAQWHVLAGGLSVGVIYGWRFWEFFTAFRHDKHFPEEPKQLHRSWFVTQMGIEVVFSSILIPICIGAFKYNGPVPLPQNMYNKSLFATIKDSIRTSGANLSYLKKDVKSTMSFSVQKQHFIQVLKTIKLL